MFCSAPFCDLPGADFPIADSLAIDDPFASLALDPDLELQYIIELYPYDQNAEINEICMPQGFGFSPFCDFQIKKYGGINMIGLADQRFISSPDSSVPNKYFIPVVNNPLQFDVSIMRGDTLGIGAVSFGAIEIRNGDGSLDYLAGLNWKGRRIVIKTARKGWEYDLFTPVFDGLINGIELADQVVTITFRDIGLRLDLEIESPNYAGTGGIEGNANLDGKMKPLLYGECFNIEPVLVDPVNLVYQVHAFGIEAVDAVYDAGVALTNDGDVADITLATPGAGEFITQLDAGLIKLGSTPAGRITANVRGDNEGGYVETVADITRRIVKTRIGFQSLTDDMIEGQSFDELNDEIPGASGIYITDRGTVRQAIDMLIPPCGAYWYFSRVGKLTCDFIAAPGTPDTTINEDFIDTAGIDAPLPITGAWRISVAYAPVWTVQGEDEIAGAATESQRSFVGQEYRFTVYENPVRKETDPHAIERIFYTNLADKADADALLARLVQIYGVDRNIYRVPVYGALYRNYLGDNLRLEYPRYGINKNVSIIGVSENAERQQTVMELWG